MAEKSWRIDWSELNTRSDLEKKYNQWMKAANRRIDSWMITGDVKGGRGHSPAYQNLYSFKGTDFIKETPVKKGSRYKEIHLQKLPKNATEAQIRQALRVTEQFLTAETSTEKGYKRIIEKRDKQLKEAFPDLSYKQRQDLLEWMGNKSRNGGYEYMKNERRYGNSDLVREAISKKMIQSGMTAEQAYLDMTKAISAGKSKAEYIREIEMMDL